MMAQPSFAAGSKTYSADLPTAGRQRSPVALTTLFNEILTWINGVYAGTGDASSANQALLSMGNGNLTYSNVFRSNVDIQHTGGNGTIGQALVSNGDGTTEWATVGTLTDADKGDITVATSGTVWTIDNGVVDTDALAENGVTLSKIVDINGSTLLGRYSATSGDLEQITLNGDLAFSSSELTVNGGIWYFNTLTAEETTSSTSYQDVNGVLLTPAANTTYHVKVLVNYEKSTGNLIFSFTEPTGMEIITGTGQLPGGAPGNSTVWNYPSYDNGTVSNLTGNLGLMNMDMVVRSGASPSGSLQLRWKSDGSSGTIRNGTMLMYTEVPN